MSWKEGLLIFLILCVVVVVCLARHFFADAVFLAEHFIAAGLIHAPALLHFAVGYAGAGL